MIIVPGRARDGKSDKRSSTFTGSVWADPVLPSTGGVTINTVFFAPCAHTYWHHHQHGQILQVLAGTGFVCAIGELPQLIRPGDLVWTPPGEQHWHGATRGSFMSHLAISLGTTAWGQEVAEADYNASDNE